MGGERHAAVACGCAARGVSGVGREFQSDAGCSARLCSDARWEECVAVQLLGGEGVKQGTGNREQGTGNREQETGMDPSREVPYTPKQTLQPFRLSSMKRALDQSSCDCVK